MKRLDVLDERLNWDYVLVCCYFDKSLMLPEQMDKTIQTLRFVRYFGLIVPHDLSVVKKSVIRTYLIVFIVTLAWNKSATCLAIVFYS